MNEILKLKLSDFDWRIFEKINEEKNLNEIVELPGKSQAIKTAFKTYRLNFVELYLAACVMNQEKEDIKPTLIEAKTLIMFNL